MGYSYSGRPARRSFSTSQHTKLPSLCNEAQSYIHKAIRQWDPDYSNRTAPSSTRISPTTAFAMVDRNIRTRADLGDCSLLHDKILEQAILDCAFVGLS